MSKAIVNRVTGEALTVELELGEDLWLRDEHGDIEQAKRNHFPLERWRFVGSYEVVDDTPVMTMRTQAQAGHSPTASERYAT